MTRLPLGRAHLLASTIRRAARRAGIPLESLSPVGSLRRFAPDVGDVSLLGVALVERHAEVLEGLSALPEVAGLEERTDASLVLRTDRGVVRVLLATPHHAGSALVRLTGSRRHVETLQARADRMRVAFAAPTEEQLYAQLALPFIPPELREDGDEIAAAERGDLPRLLTDLHIRGDLHMHSTWSDGRDSIADMARASRQLGYEYIAITDHSERSWASRSLRADQVAAQREEIEALRAQFPAMEILHGVEVDIMKDGTLDFPDEVLEPFDIVLASLHDHGGQEGQRLTERYLRAIEHPLVSVITHPANRSPAQSAGYDVDFDRLFAAAAETGTAMEIDGAPGHLDMDGRLARRAAAAGVTIVVDSDCHRADALARQMRFGVATARRGWIEPQQVLNTHGVADVRAFIARKRGRAG